MWLVGHMMAAWEANAPCALEDAPDPPQEAWYLLNPEARAEHEGEDEHGGGGLRLLVARHDGAHGEAERLRVEDAQNDDERVADERFRLRALRFCEARVQWQPCMQAQHYNITVHLQRVRGRGRTVTRRPPIQ